MLLFHGGKKLAIDDNLLHDTVDCSRCRELETTVENYKQNQKRAWQEVSLILSSIPLGLVVANNDEKIEATNSQIRELAGYNTEELYKKSVREIFPNLKKLETTKEKTDLFGKGEIVIPVEISINNLVWEGSSKWLIHIKDISEEHRLLEYKMNLAAILSHDIRTPLSAMRSVLELTHDGNYGELSEDGIKATAWALASSEYAQIMLTNLLDSERLESNSLVCTPIETSTAKIVENSVELCELYAQSNNVAIETQYSNEAFKADQSQLIQILVNLISNAVKYSKPGHAVTVQAGIEGLKVHFRVVDNGPGISPELHEKIFDKFEQARGSSTKGGFGLGLSISKALAELNNGSLSLKSKVGEGSTFELSIPFMDTEQ